MTVMVSEQYQFVIGVDTHAATHTLALVAAATGALIDHVMFPSTTAGLSRAHGWIIRRVADELTLVVVEGIGSYGAILTDRLGGAGLKIVEAAKMPANDRRGTGKSDVPDAVRMARAVLGLEIRELRTPRTVPTDGARVAMRVLVVARDQMTGEQARTINALTALARTVHLGVDARKSLTIKQIATIAGWREGDEDVTMATCRTGVGAIVAAAVMIPAMATACPNLNRLFRSPEDTAVRVRSQPWTPLSDAEDALCAPRHVCRGHLREPSSIHPISRTWSQSHPSRALHPGPRRRADATSLLGAGGGVRT